LPVAAGAAPGLSHWAWLRMTMPGMSMERTMLGFSTGSGSPLTKDFWDIHALLNHLSFDVMLRAFQIKYSHASCWGLDKSLAYFEDAENEPDPVSLTSVQWRQVKADILEQIRLR